MRNHPGDLLRRSLGIPPPQFPELVPKEVLEASQNKQAHVGSS